jgi:hypothetical protein
VPESLHRQIKEAAKRSGRSMSDELAWRAGLSFVWEKTFGDARKVLDDAYRVTAGTLRQAMIDAGYTPFSTSGGRAWAEPGSAISEAVKKELGEIKAGPS